MFAAIYIPQFSLQSALRLEPDLRTRPVALVDGELTKATVLEMTPAARQDGVVEGQTASQAKARCENLIIRHRSPAQEQSATDILLQVAGSFSPRLEATAPGVCTIELTGLGLGGEAVTRRWASKILSALAPFQLEAQIGFGATPGLALITAQAAAGGIALMEQPELFVRALPVAALHPPPEITAVLKLWGIHTIGAFRDLGKDNLAERLGPAAAALFDSLEAGRPLNIVIPPQAFVERVEFPCEIETTEPLLFVLRRLLEQLARRLDLVYLVVAELELQLTLASGDKYARALKIPSPTNQLSVLFRTLQTHLDTLRTESPIIALQLQAQPGRSECHQFGLFETTLRDPNQFGETLARLIALCGAENVGTPQLTPTHRPDVFGLATPDFSKAAANEKGCDRPRIGLQLRRYRPPVAATIEFREQRPAAIRSAAVSGVVQAVGGPFLSSGDWWDEHGWGREEWDAQLADGALCRVFRTDGGCFVEGVYD